MNRKQRRFNVDCKVCTAPEAEYDISNGNNTYEVTVCDTCLVRIVRWSQDVAEWEERFGENPFTDKKDVAFVAPVYDFIQTI